MKPILVIYNPKSGSSCLRKVQAACKQHAIQAQYHRIQPNLKQLITAAEKDGCEVVVAAGGDGTVNAVAAQLVGSTMRLAVLPCGTLNHFAKDLGIPLDVEDAIALLKAGHSKKVDIGQVNDRFFVNNSSVGIYPALVRERDKHSRILGKWPAAVWALVIVMFRIRRRQLILTIDDKQIKRRTPFVFVGNNSYNIDEFGFNNRDRLDGGTLSIYLIKTANIFTILRILLFAMVGRARSERDFEVFSGKELKIQAKHAQLQVAFDGEVALLQTPLHFKIRNASLRVVAPRSSRNSGHY